MSSKFKEFEEAGIDVISTDKQGKLDYATKMNNGSEYCDSCEALQFLPDPDPTDWFHDGDRKAVCTQLGVTIAGSLEPREMTNIEKPLYCPKLGRELTQEEQKMAKITFELAKVRR